MPVGSRLLCRSRPRATIVALLVALCSASPRTSFARASSPLERPNIVFIMADDLGPEWISCYGAEGIETPAIDKLAAGGMRFTAAYAMPKCTPTRVTLLTGQYPFRHGWVNHWDVPRWGAGCHFDPRHNLTFARVLRDAGYATAIAGKWQINDFRVQPEILAEHGFDDWCMWTGFETGIPPSAERYHDPYIHTRAGSRTHKGAFGADVFAKFVGDFVERHRERPFLVYFPMALTHGPLVPTPREPEATGTLGRHRAMVRYMDEIVGRVVHSLERHGVRDRTVVVFTTDNGTSAGIRGSIDGREVKGGKGTLGENGCRVPFIVNAPGIVPEGVVTDCLTDFTDVFPTLCELAGAEVPRTPPVHGRSLAPVLLGKTAAGPRDWILAMGGGVARLTKEGRIEPAVSYAARALRDHRFKIVVGEDRSTAALYDLVRDPGETRNLLGSDDPAAAAARRRLEDVAARLPTRDAAPRYDPTPAAAWDRKP